MATGCEAKPDADDHRACDNGRKKALYFIRAKNLNQQSKHKIQRTRYDNSACRVRQRCLIRRFFNDLAAFSQHITDGIVSRCGKALFERVGKLPARTCGCCQYDGCDKTEA